MSTSSTTKVLGMAGLLAAAAAVMIGCHALTTEPVATNDYRAEGLLILDRNIDSTIAAVSLERNDSTLANAAVNLAGVPLGFFAALLPVDSVYLLKVDTAARFAGDNVYLSVADATRYRDSGLVAVPDTFSINGDFSPANHLLNGVGQVAFSWTLSPNSIGYVVATVKAEEAYTGTGYSAYAASGATAGTIPPDAFIDPISSEPDTGLYNVYVYAISGAPDSLLSSYLLPVPLPGQLADNLDWTSLAGRFGAVSVVRCDTVRVAVGR